MCACKSGYALKADGRSCGDGSVRQWTRQLGTSASDEGTAIAVDNNDGVYVTGYTLGNLDGNMNAGSHHMFTTKYISSGEKKWTRQMGNIGSALAYGIATDGGSGIYVTGFTGGSLDGNANFGLSDVFIVKYNSEGVRQWTRQFGTSSGEIGFGIAVDGSSGVYVTGQTSGSLDGNTNAGGRSLPSTAVLAISSGRGSSEAPARITAGALLLITPMASMSPATPTEPWAATPTPAAGTCLSPSTTAQVSNNGQGNLARPQMTRVTALR